MKYVQKLCALNWKTDAVSRPCVGFLSLDITEKIWMSEAWILRFDNHYSFVFEIPGDWKNELFSQGTYNFQNLRNETLATADQEYVKMSKLVLFKCKVTGKRRQHIAYLE